MTRMQTAIPLPVVVRCFAAQTGIRNRGARLARQCPLAGYSRLVRRSLGEVGSLVAAGVALAVGITVQAQAAPQQMKITLGGYTNRTETLTNFPVLVVLSNNVSGSGFTYSNFLSASGYDLRFRNAADTADLNYEIESWNTNAASCVWVQVPAIPGDGSGCIWARWGDTASSSQLPCTTNGATWKSDYVGVWHLPNGTTLTASDSTTNANHGTITNATAAAGVAGGAGSFNGSSAYVNLTALPGHDLNTACAIDCWAYISQLKECDILQRGFGEVGSGQMLWVAADGTFYWGPQYDNPQITCSVGADQWLHIVCTKSASALAIFINGSQANSQSASFSFSRTDEFYLGYGWDGYFNGAIDEVRVSSTVPSSDWIWAEYMNTASNTVFNNYGQVGALSAPAIENQPVGNLTSNSATFHGNLVNTGDSSATVCALWGETSGGANWSSWANTNWFAAGVWTNNTYPSTNIVGLSVNTTYYYTFAATNATGSVVAPAPVSFTTLEATEADGPVFIVQ